MPFAWFTICSPMIPKCFLMNSTLDKAKSFIVKIPKALSLASKLCPIPQTLCSGVIGQTLSLTSSCLIVAIPLGALFAYMSKATFARKKLSPIPAVAHSPNLSLIVSNIYFTNCSGVFL